MELLVPPAWPIAAGRASRRAAIVLSGETGAGKTEASKHLLHYLSWRGCGSAGKGGVAARVLASSPLFEAFGNAKTFANSNSSRFGKFIRLKFSDGTVQGSLIDTYLLEKSRLAAQQAGERNFHIFYQMLAGLPDDTASALQLTREGPYKLLGGGLHPFARVGASGSSGGDSGDSETEDRRCGGIGSARDRRCLISLLCGSRAL